MLGAIAGDIIGSVYERMPIKTTSFPLFEPRSHFTDDTVMTIAVAQVLLEGLDYASTLQSFGRRYPNAGYGGTFYHWLFQESPQPYNSWGNGSAMRASPVGLALDSVETLLQEAERSALVTHNHPEGIKGAQAAALAVFLARRGESKATIRAEIAGRFDYDLARTLDEIRPTYEFDVSCQGSVPESILAFLESDDYEDAVRKAVSLGGDSDTMACVAGSIAAAHYGGVPEEIAQEAQRRLPAEFLEVMAAFKQRFG